MFLIPSIELQDNKVVLTRQTAGGVLVKEPHPASLEELVTEFTDAGADRLHIVDLDGALHAKPMNLKVIREILDIVADSNDFTEVQIGGGIRTLDQIDQYLQMGVDYVVIGTAAYKQPGFLHDACSNFGGNVILAMDAVDGMIHVDGWKAATRNDIFTFAAKVEDFELDSILYNDIRRSGSLGGMDVDTIVRLARSSRIPVIAAGGLGGMDDLKRLCEHEEDGVAGVVMSRSLYEKKIDFEAACNYVDSL